MCGAGFVFPNGPAIAMMRHGNMAGMASALLGTIQFIVAAVGTILMGTIESSTAIPMTVVICGCGLAATVFNFAMLGSRLEVGPTPTTAPAASASH
jgi:DHA1 family bicyclomycin/chloramphenicol resistance-like MFS transporter